MLALAACQPAADTSSSAPAAQSQSASQPAGGAAPAPTLDPKKADGLRRNARDMQPGAEVSDYIDEDGNQRFGYKNPNGGAGGGVAG